MSNSVEKNNDTKKITALIILIVTVMVTTTSATYAFFQFSAINNNTITGTAATASLTFSAVPTLIAPTIATYTSKPLVPQLEGTTTNILQKALTGASGKDKCVDANDNAICRAYSFTIRNDSSATAVIKGQVRFFTSKSGSAPNETLGLTFANLKWKLMSNATTVAISSSATGTVATTSWTNFATGVSLAPGATQTYYMIIWIHETGSNQNNTDKGTFMADIQFVNNTDGTGITSTITS